MEKIEAYRNLREKVWDDESKIFGWEVIDIRFGGLFARLKSAQKRLNAYLDGKLAAVSELEEERLLFHLRQKQRAGSVKLQPVGADRVGISDVMQYGMQGGK